MVIVHYINNLGSGGAEKLLTDILPKLNEKHTVYLIVSNDFKSVPKYHYLLEDSGVIIENLNISFYNPLNIFKLLAFVKRKRVNILHTHLFPTQYWAAIASFFFNKKINLVKNEHSTNNKRQKLKVLRLFEKIIYSRYDCIIAITPEIKKKLVSWVGFENKIKVIHNGVNLNQINNAEPSNDSLGVFNSNNYNILMVGRFDSMAKDHETLVKAISLLSDEFYLYLAGEGPNMHKIKKLVENLEIQNNVIFLGYRNDVYSLMKSCDLNVLCSFYEGLSGVTLESLASGKPFIGSDVPGINNIVPNQNFLFEPNSPEILANKISEIVKDKLIQQKMIDEGLKWVKNFDLDFMVESYTKLYSELDRSNQ